MKIRKIVTGKITNIEEALKAVKEGAFALKHIPEQFKTHGLRRIAVQRNSGALEYVPEVDSA